ncbi:hypothetical protein PIROE2DRAFT_68493 [Piromyces sp. E2]|nr:hypothetical protein PIROE2DRAFT_68493 [Piromyces sp. E2]|eukprot:OUM69769.1 hypothetical protein PIROE2DRAFT_68493 [Piromyces sp. E2]
MFGKKTLSLVGLLFLGSQFTKVSAAGTCTFGSVSAPSTCEVSSCTVGDYGLYYKNSLVVEVTGAAACHIVTTPGYYKIGDKYYSINHEGTTTEIEEVMTIIRKSYCRDKVGKFVKIGSAGEESICLTASTATAAFSSGDYYLINASEGNTYAASAKKVIIAFGANSVTKVDSSTNYHLVVSEVGDVKTEGQNVVVDTTLAKAFLTGTNKYLVINGVSAVKAGGVGKAIVVDNTGALDQSFNGKGDVCVDTTTKIITTRPENYCGSDCCEKYYACIGDICTETTTTFDERAGECDPTHDTKQHNCTPGGYYIVSDGNELLSEPNNLKNNKLYHCSGSPGSATCTQDQTTVGYLANADTANAEAVPYIQCSAKATTIDNGLDVQVTTNECVPIAKPDGTCAVGKLIYEVTQYKLCIDGTNKMAVGAASSYLVNAMTASTFVPAEKKPTGNTVYYVLVNMDTDGNVILNEQVKTKYRYAHTGNGDATKTRRVYEKNGDDSMCSGEPGSLTLDADNAKEYVLNYTDGDYVDFYKENN